MKARNREINIFNMSLLDILCGALGAFCFLMLSLLPYYRPPGEDITINQEQKKLLDEVQKIKDLAERLKFTSNAEDLTELVKKLQEQILLLENEIKRLQGHLNALLAENADLKKKVQALEQERQELLARLDQLEAENKKLLAENNELRARLQQSEAERQRLAKENERLRGENEQLRKDLSRKNPWVVSMTSENASQAIDLSLHEVSLQLTDGGFQPGFDPAKKFQPLFFRGDKTFKVGSTYHFLSAEQSFGSVKKLYVSLVNDPPGRTTTRLMGSAAGSGLSPLNPINVPDLTLTPDRPWMLAGFFSVANDGNLTYRAATDGEREAEWNRLMHPEVPQTEKPEAEKPQPAPGMTRAELIERRRRMNQIEVDRFLKSGLPGLDPAAKSRVREYAARLLQAATMAERLGHTDQAMAQARSSSEHRAIQTIMSIAMPLPPPDPTPGPSPKPTPAPTPGPPPTPAPTPAPTSGPRPGPPPPPTPGPSSGPAIPLGVEKK